ncbi:MULTISPECIES: hypothetical protein [Streptomyces]|nr:hypothetical protein [Streptomyces scabiei]MDX3112845.1 hypothetical protein [Streptomyces scabiei]
MPRRYRGPAHRGHEQDGVAAAVPVVVVPEILGEFAYLIDESDAR